MPVASPTRANSTGDPYSVQFSVSGSTTTYSVLRNGAATALTNVPYVVGPGDPDRRHGVQRQRHARKR